MNRFFALLSAAYIFGIFYFADSSAASQIGEYNPFSLLHIPLYGILTILLLLTFTAAENDQPKSRYLVAGLIALSVGCLDEFHQIFIPTRDGSFGDVLLDLAGIALVMILAHVFPPPRWKTLLDEIRKRVV